MRSSMPAPGRGSRVLNRAEMRTLHAEALADYNEARCVWNANPATIKTSSYRGRSMSWSR